MPTFDYRGGGAPTITPNQGSGYWQNGTWVPNGGSSTPDYSRGVSNPTAGGAPTHDYRGGVGIAGPPDTQYQPFHYGDIHAEDFTNPNPANFGVPGADAQRRQLNWLLSQQYQMPNVNIPGGAANDQNMLGGTLYQQGNQGPSAQSPFTGMAAGSIGQLGGVAGQGGPPDLNRLSQLSGPQGLAGQDVRGGALGAAGILGGIAGAPAFGSSFRGDQAGLVGQLQRQASGQDSLSRLLMNQGIDQATAAQRALAAGARPGTEGVASREAAQNAARVQAQMTTQGTQAALQERMQAAQALGGLLGQARGQDLGEAQFNQQGKLAAGSALGNLYGSLYGQDVQGQLGMLGAQTQAAQAATQGRLGLMGQQTSAAQAAGQLAGQQRGLDVQQQQQDRAANLQALQQYGTLLGQQRGQDIDQARLLGDLQLRGQGQGDARLIQLLQLQQQLAEMQQRGGTQYEQQIGNRFANILGKPSEPSVWEKIAGTALGTAGALLPFAL